MGEAPPGSTCANASPSPLDLRVEMRSSLDEDALDALAALGAAPYAWHIMPHLSIGDRLVDTHYLVRLLSEVYRPEGVEIWLHARNPGLNGERPIDLLSVGDSEHVVQAVERLQSGVM